MMVLPWQHTGSLGLIHYARAHFHDNIIKNLNHKQRAASVSIVKLPAASDCLPVLAKKLRLQNVCYCNDQAHTHTHTQNKPQVKLQASHPYPLLPLKQKAHAHTHTQCMKCVLPGQH